jgi:hypothetical protein
MRRIKIVHEACCLCACDGVCTLPTKSSSATSPRPLADLGGRIGTCVCGSKAVEMLSVAITYGGALVLAALDAGGVGAREEH